MPVFSHLSTVYRPDFGLCTDLYQLTMAAGYYQQGMHERRAIFHLFYRRPPFGGDFALAAGLPLAIDLINRLRFSADDVQYLGRLKGNNGTPLFKEPFLNYLQRLKFSGTVHAVPEGEIVLPHEPLLRIEGTLIECQLLETALLTVMNFSTLIATKAARVKAAAGEDAVIEFGLRRAQGIDGGLTASRAAYIGGCAATSNVWAGRYYGIPVKGTHAHSWVMSFPDEEAAFSAYAEAMPDNGILLVDTYDTLEGVAKAIETGKELRRKGHEMLGIRLDSGDLAKLSIAARKLLDEAGFPNVKIVASNDIDEHTIHSLKEQKARIDTWGIGTKLVTANDQPALGGVYKLAAIQNEKGEWEPKIKRSDTLAKISNPGKLNVRSFHFMERGTSSPHGRVLYNEFDGTDMKSYTLKGGEQIDIHRHDAIRETDLLVPVFEEGVLNYAPPTLQSTRDRALNNWRWWSSGKEGNQSTAYLESRLYELKQSMLAE